MNEVSFRARPHHNVHSTLGVDIGATGPRWRVDSIEGGRIERGGERLEGWDGIRLKTPVTQNLLYCHYRISTIVS
jgi:hypothetical protein